MTYFYIFKVKSHKKNMVVPHRIVEMFPIGKMNQTNRTKVAMKVRITTITGESDIEAIKVEPAQLNI